MPQQFLHGPDVVSPLKEKGGEGVPEAVTGHSLVDPGHPRHFGHGALRDCFVKVVPSLSPFAVPPPPRRWRDPVSP